MIKVENVSKSFRLPHERFTGLKQAVINFRPGKRYEVQHVLDDVTFEIKSGEFFGIVGRNGSGKSTLLKVLAQIYTPEKGGVQINGSLTPFIELGVGFNPELTGRENVFLNGALLGFDRTQVAEMYDDIVDFAEIPRFMDQKLKNYSSGMQVRLAFSIAIRAKSDILLIDEVLAVGDAAFQQKCYKYFDKLRQEKRTIVFVSHDMGTVKQFCDRALLLDNGKMKLLADPTEVAREYDRLNFGQDETEGNVNNNGSEGPEITLHGQDNKMSTKFEFGVPIGIKMTWPNSPRVGDAGVIIYKGIEVIFATNSFNRKDAIGTNGATLTINPKLGNGRYRAVLGLFGNSKREIIPTAAEQEFFIYNQPDIGSNGEEWVGVSYIENKWDTHRSGAK